ncbi:MAG TPA: hypothetical protein VEJ42_02610 [Streptosporangiaceae bacterium]|nr:hypothetical protein [Streptosporangiaceae bacterium]
MADRSGSWTVEFYQDDSGREPCREWAESLSSQKRAAFQAVLRLVLIPRGLDIVGSEYGKALGQGLYELRIRWTASEVAHKVSGLDVAEVGTPEKILLRVFFCTAGRKIILLMSGYDKADDPSERRQNREIQRARKMITAYQEARKRERPQR